MLKPWREVITPHPDVAAGRYKQAEFAADLAQVFSGKAEVEYQNPEEFFSRTYLTDGMTRLLKSTIERICGGGGEPVVQLKTAFGGGKTHTMLAIYHLIKSQSPSKLEGIGKILSSAQVSRLPETKIAVIVGTALDPARPRKHKGLKGKSVNTLWGEIAYQIGGTDGYKIVQSSDEAGVSPGSDTILELLEQFSPCVILVDELVAYARNIYSVNNLPAGTFDSNMTFIQALTEAVKRSQNSLLVASIPESDIEIGGEGGKNALEIIEKTFGRIEAVWKPVGAMEGFEIVRRRLFGNVTDLTARDTVCREFVKMYADNPTDFPRECSESKYHELLKSSYPIHPEVFDRLYEDWGTLEKFQKTRGVLRLMASVIHELWISGDKSLLLLPGSIPLGAPAVRDEITRYLPEGWNNVIDTDIDGARSKPKEIDSLNPRFGKIMAATRVARAVFLGSAPSVKQQKIRGVENTRINLSVLQPEEPVSILKDTLSRLTEKLTHFYSGTDRYWYDLPPNLRRTVEDRAIRYTTEDVAYDLERRLAKIKDKGTFCAVHVCPQSSDVPDLEEARLIILPPGDTHSKNKQDTKALVRAKDILFNRGNAPRINRNMLLFVASDSNSLIGLEHQVRQYLAWKSVMEDCEVLNLDAHQRKQAKESEANADETVNLRLQELYTWLLAPVQHGSSDIEWEIQRLAGGDNIITRITKEVKTSGLLVDKWSSENLKIDLDNWLWKNEPHIKIETLLKYFCSYCYLQKLRDKNVLLQAIKEGVTSSTFGYASCVDQNGKYQNLRIGRDGEVRLDGFIVKLEVADKQIKEEEEKKRVYIPVEDSEKPVVNEKKGSYVPIVTSKQTSRGIQETLNLPPQQKTRYYGSVKIDPVTLVSDIDKIAKEIIQHLEGLVSADLEITLDIHAKVPDGIPDDVVRTVTENSRTLNFDSSEFDE